MRQGEELKTTRDPKVEIQERGEIFFFYRPKIGIEEEHNADEVQRLYIVLRPESGERRVEVKQASDSGKEGASVSGEKSDGGKVKSTGGIEGGHGSEEVNIEKQPLLRFIIIGRKSLPDPGKRGRPYWCFVDLVTTDVEDIKKALKGGEYDTATRGHRQKPPARPLAEGVYRIVKHIPGKRAHTHLIYKLEFPPQDQKNELQESLKVEPEGSFLIQIKSPNQPSTGAAAGLQKKRRAVFPAHLQGKFGHLRYAPADPPDFLNYEGCEFLLISASDDIEEELGLEIKPEEEMKSSSCLDLIKMFREAISATPLLKSTWA